MFSLDFVGLNFMDAKIHTRMTDEIPRFTGRDTTAVIDRLACLRIDACHVDGPTMICLNLNRRCHNHFLQALQHVT